MFLRRNIDLSFRKSSPLRWYKILKVYLKNIYTRHYFKMRKILTGAKLLLMSIASLGLCGLGDCHFKNVFRKLSNPFWNDLTLVYTYSA